MLHLNMEALRAKEMVAFFLDLDEQSIKKYLIDTNLSIIDTKITEDVRVNRNTKWLNLILRKIN